MSNENSFRFKFKPSVGFLVAAFIAILCSICILFFCYQEEYVESACSLIYEQRNEEAKKNIDKIWNINRVSSNQETMLMAACKSGNVEIIKYLIQKDADVNYSTPGCLTPLELLCRYGYESGRDALPELLSSGANQHDYTEKPPVFHLFDFIKTNNLRDYENINDDIMMLLEHGSPLYYNGTTVLHIAAKENMYDLFYDVVHTKEGIALMNVVDNEGCTPWDVSIKYGAIDIQRIIRNIENEYNSSLDVQENE